MYLTGHNLRSCTKQTSKLLRSLRGRGNCWNMSLCDFLIIKSTLHCLWVREQF
jgi:hypothetical protein